MIRTDTVETLRAEFDKLAAQYERGILTGAEFAEAVRSLNERIGALTA